MTRSAECLYLGMARRFRVRGLDRVGGARGVISLAACGYKYISWVSVRNLLGT